MERPSTDVIIVGAGPTGLLLAGDLAAAGAEVTIMEKRTTESNLTRAFAVHARSLETLDMRGVADKLLATGTMVPRVQLLGSRNIELSELKSRYPFVLVTAQYHTEAVLRERALSLGVSIEHGAEVTGLRQDDSGVDVDYVDPHGGTNTRRASYLVGTDGLRSAVRDALGLPFPGQRAVGAMMLADVKFAEPPQDVLAISGNGYGFALAVPFGDGWWRVICRRAGDDTAEDVPADLEQIRDLLLHTFGTDFGMHETRWMSRFHSDERQAPHYQVGRVFLAGDAAHVHSPAGGQGMNIGLQDAANLGWKLAAAVFGWAPPGLLDSYETERHPIGKQVLRGSGALLRMILLRNPVLRTVRNGMLNTALNIDPIAHKVSGLLSGIGVRYPAPKGAPDAVGERAPDVALAAEDGGPQRLYEALRGGRFVFVTPHVAPSLPEELAGRVDVLAPSQPDGTATLVRPDGYIAWTGPAGQTPRWGYWTKPQAVAA
jgi:2-polyprenyl-6-methoxyphenol hydroxylase-like FAD-dependent oxidoreductase